MVKRRGRSLALAQAQGGPWDRLALTTMERPQISPGKSMSGKSSEQEQAASARHGADSNQPGHGQVVGGVGRPAPNAGAAVLDHTVDLPPIAEGPGTVIGRYKLLQKIGEGGFGVVYMA